MNRELLITTLISMAVVKEAMGMEKTYNRDAVERLRHQEAERDHFKPIPDPPCVQEYRKARLERAARKRTQGHHSVKSDIPDACPLPKDTTNDK